jgi:sialidase-1
VIINHNKVAAYYRIPTINLAQEVTERIDHGEFTWEEDFMNLHPSPFGQGVYARSIIQFLDSAFELSPVAVCGISSYPFPEALDSFCYEHGFLMDISEAEPVIGWKKDPLWESEDGSGTRPNYTKVPMLIGEEPGSLLKLDFMGKAVGIAVAAGPDAGMVEYRIDGGPWQEQNLFTRWSSQLHLPWYYTLSAELACGRHLLELRISKGKDERSSGHACRIRYFYVNGE